MGIRSQVPFGKGSETREQSRRFQAESKRLAPLWGEEIVRSNRKRLAAQKAMEGNYRIEENGCWTWTSGTSHGYGTLRLREIYGEYPIYAHRLSYLLVHGPIPKGTYICHHCDNPICVNPDHLFAGSQDDNLRDMASKGRSCLGIKNSQSKLTDEEVEQIRWLSSSGVKQYLIAEMYSVSQAQISRIIRGKRRPTAGGTVRQKHGNYKHGHYAVRYKE